MIRQVAHQARLMDDLLDVTRIRHGKIGLRREPVDLPRLIRDTVEDNRAGAEQAELPLTLHTRVRPAQEEAACAPNLISSQPSVTSVPRW